jgi:hypothetical protein
MKFKALQSAYGGVNTRDNTRLTGFLDNDYEEKISTTTLRFAIAKRILSHHTIIMLLEPSTPLNL